MLSEFAATAAKWRSKHDPYTGRFFFFKNATGNKRAMRDHFVASCFSICIELTRARVTFGSRSPDHQPVVCFVATRESLAVCACANGAPNE